MNAAFSLGVIHFTVKPGRTRNPPACTCTQRIKGALQKVVTRATMESRSANERDVQLLPDGQRRLPVFRHRIREPCSPAVREEPTNEHRSLHPSHRPWPFRPPRHGARARAGVGAGTGEGSPQSMGSDVLTCTPWAGLFVEGPAAS